jgi:hypothetical protein
LVPHKGRSGNHPVGTTTASSERREVTREQQAVSRSIT